MYLSLPPGAINLQEVVVDEEILQCVCGLSIRGVTPEGVREAVLHPLSARRSSLLHDLKVAYELLLDAKRHKQRIADVMLALADPSRTPPVSASPRIVGLGQSPSAPSPLSQHQGAFLPTGPPGSGGSAAGGGQGQAVGARPPAPPAGAVSDAAKEAAAKKRRWYLGIQSKNEPGHVMTEVYKALQALDCRWHPVTNYRVCRLLMLLLLLVMMMLLLL
jgi:5'-AMP-activated protein kinase catalytic alpha subunit